MSALLIPNIGLPPEKAGFSSTAKYKLKNDTLETFDKGGAIITIIYIINNNLFGIRSPDGKEIEMFYLKRVIKK